MTVYKPSFRMATYSSTPSADPPPFPADEIIANRLSGAAWPVVPHRCTSTRIFLVESKSSGPQAGPALFWQGVGVDWFMAHCSRSFPRSSIKHRAGVPCPVSAQPRDLGRHAIVKPRSYWPPDNRHTAQNPVIVRDSNCEPMPNNRPAVPVHPANKLIRCFQVGWHDSQSHGVEQSAQAGRATRAPCLRR